jgi:hypothetical protein
MPKPWTVAAPLLVVLALAPRSVSPGANPSHCVTVEDFSRARPGEFPADWKPRKDAGKDVYSVQEEGGRRFLRAVAKGLGIQAAKPHEWDLAQYPLLSWSWRVRQFPDGSDERKTKANDSALAVYVVWPHSPMTVKSLKYVWSAVAPVGTALESSQGLTKVRVVRSGTEPRGAWVEEQVNVVEDYRRAFGETVVPKAAGIAVLTDADDTRSSASGDYADFRRCRG